MSVLQVGAVAAYVWQCRWNDALYWLGALIINLAVYWRATQ
jgi:hypothetical protein